MKPELPEPDKQTQWALHVARCWKADKMIGGNEDDVRNKLLAEVERLQGLIQVAYRQGLEDAANACEDIALDKVVRYGTIYSSGASACASAIRGMME